MCSRDLRDPYAERERTGAPWILLFLLTMGAMLVGYGLSSGGSGQRVPSSSTSQQPPIYETVAAVQLTWMAPTPTRNPGPPTLTPTPRTIVVTATASPTVAIEFCDTVGNRTPCAIPPRAMPTGTALPRCDVVTPKVGYPVYCEKTDEFGTAMEDSTE